MQPSVNLGRDQLSQIRRQMVRGPAFRAYRAQTTALTGVLAIIARTLQPRIVPEPWLQLPAYLGLWCGLAVVSAAIFSIELAIRCRRLASPLQNERTYEAIERFVPSLVAGGMITVVFFHFLPAQLWMLPG